ncbi:MAG: CYTH protein [Magnetococcales bacterium]|nr:CYTH protein [Magnetococcales bacterium]HIJ82636.1 CYTH domain-containing protein [Magnetococcales bacterium]
MGIEIERRFLVQDDRWRHGASSTCLRQGFLSTDKDRVVRVRIVGEVGTLTIKGRTRDNAKSEYEYVIPSHEALEMLNGLCLKPLIEKRRFRIVHAGMVWEVDEFEGENRGLVVAEIELEHVDQSFAKPPWLGTEVSADPRYFNSNLANHPYCRWGKE